MVYVWTGLTQAMGLRYYGVPGIGIPADVGFNYIEPPEGQAWMREDEYDALIDDPTGFLYEVWFPRVCADAAPMGGPCTFRNNLAFVKGGMAMLQYFYAFGPQIQRLRTECGTASAIAGIFKAPFDILADKLRGYVGLTMDMHTQPDKVLKACEALMPHLCHVGLTTADPAKQVPIGFWMHRGCVPFVNPAPVRLALLAHAQADHRGVLEARAPNPVLCRRQMGASLRRLPRTARPQHRLSLRPRRHLRGASAAARQVRPERRRAQCPAQLRQRRRSARLLRARDPRGRLRRRLHHGRRRHHAERYLAREPAHHDPGRPRTGRFTPAGGYQVTAPDQTRGPQPTPADLQRPGLANPRPTRRAPGVCVPWAEKQKELPEITGDVDLVRRVWEANDALGNVFIWQCLLSF